MPLVLKPVIVSWLQWVAHLQTLPFAPIEIEHVEHVILPGIWVGHILREVPTLDYRISLQRIFWALLQEAGPTFTGKRWIVRCFTCFDTLGGLNTLELIVHKFMRLSDKGHLILMFSLV